MRNIKGKLLLIFMALGFISLTSCDKLKDLISFDKDLEVTVYFSPQAEAGMATHTSNTFNPGIQSALEDNNLDASDAEAKLQSLMATLESPDNARFATLESIEVYIVVGGTEKKIAWKEAVSTDVGATLSLSVDSEADLISLLNKSSIAFKVKYESRERLVETYIMKLNATFKVKKS